MRELDSLFYWRGIASDYKNYKGEHTELSFDAKCKILELMGVDTTEQSQILKEAECLDAKPWLVWASGLQIISEPSPKIYLNFHPDELNTVFKWQVSSSGNTKEDTFLPSELEEVGDYSIEGLRYSRRKVNLPLFRIGYYKLKITQIDGETLELNLAVCPVSAYQVEQDYGTWGFVIQLYTLRSQTNWGMGDFSDLKTLIGLCAPLGVDMIGVNPFHALQSDLKYNFSPYSPSDRRFLNPLYIDVEKAPGYNTHLKPQKNISELRQLKYVDYRKQKELKYGVLFECFKSSLECNKEELVEFIKKANKGLMGFADYEAKHTWRADLMLSNKATSTSYTSLDVYIERLLSASLQLLNEEEQLVTFHIYLQWVAENQLNQCQQVAEQSGMSIGLLRDLAVGANGCGAEVTTNPHLFCNQASIGAPPDQFSHIGQNWGIPPIDPVALKQDGFTHFIDLLRSNMSACGALRIDHAMMLMRLWWCPKDQTAVHGAYVHYPMDDMLNLLCLESHLNQCVIVAEDLGVVPDSFRNVMQERKLLANRIFYFEKHHDTVFKSPKEYDQRSLVMLDNHDVPTLTSWLKGDDITLRYRLKMLKDDEEYNYLKSLRIEEQRSLLSHLIENGVWPIEKSEPQTVSFELLSAIIHWVASTESVFFVLQIEDLIMMDEPVNLPGTYLEHKNWSRKLTQDLEDIFSQSHIINLLKSVHDIRYADQGENK